MADDERETRDRPRSSERDRRHAGARATSRDVRADGAYAEPGAASSPVVLRRCAERLRELALLAAPERLEAMVAARLAFFARRASQTPGPTLDEHIDRALDDLLNDDDGGSNEPGDHAFAARLWECDEAKARRGVVAFNALPLAVRRAWWTVVIDG